MSYILQVTLTLPGGINLHVILRPGRGEESASDFWTRTPPAQSYVLSPYPPKSHTEILPSPTPVNLTYSAAHPPVKISEIAITQWERNSMPQCMVL